MNSIEFNNILNNDIRKVNHALLTYIPDAKEGQDPVVNAMEYSLINGGKRLRPIFVLEFARACGGDRDTALPLACAIEYVHTYSLIHDDLPCMDNDDMRRGKPSCHKEFDEATALLAGDALLTHAFSAIAEADLPGEVVKSAIALLSQNSGVSGMIGGQVLDILFEDETPDIKQIVNMYRMKTGALISAACLLGCLSANAADEQLQAASKFAYSLGIAFQIQDDILDIIGDEAKLGKPVGSDAQNDKTTYASLVGIEKAKNDVRILTENAIKQLDLFDNPEFLKMLALSLINREK